MITRTIAHYEIVAPIGEGGMGVVYRALDTRLGRPVAVKLLRPDGPIDGDRRKRFVQEARAASALNHPHIVTIYDIGQAEGTDFIAMEYIAGPSLASVIGQSRMSIGDALKYGVQIADALGAAHAAGILHRDLKPANIMLSTAGDARAIKVLDFGLAKLTDPLGDTLIDERVSTGTARAAELLQTEEGTILGTAAYMSPEQAEGKAADARSDVFSFGTVLYEMITGRRAFSGATRMSTLAAILNAEPPPPSQAIPGLSPDLEKLILRCLRKSPERRWQSMADLKVALEDMREELDVRKVARYPVSTRAHRLRTILAVAVAIAAVASGAWWLATRPRPEAGPTTFLTRLTSDVGWTDYPAISLDGKMLAYASDRSGENNLDIWVQQIPDGPPVRLTNHPADEVEPSLSADGGRIAFQSNRLGGGIYIIPTLGGEERLLVARGFSPRFSPDGKWIAYGVAEQTGSRIYVAPAAGGPAVPMTDGFYRAQSPVWSPDGRHLLFWAQRHRDAPPENNVDWYIAEVPGGAPVRTDARKALLREGFQAFQGLPSPDAWASVGSRVLFHAIVGDSSNMWQVAISAEGWHVNGQAQRATFGTTDEAAASVTSDGRMVFISRTMGADIWNLPIDANRGTLGGPLKRVTQDAADDYNPTLSEDGTTLVFRSRRAGRFGVVLKRLGNGSETVITRMPEDHYPAISRDGTKVAYSFRQNGKMPIFVVAASGGSPAQVCDDCGEVEAWSPGGDQILYIAAGDPSGVGLLTLGSSHNQAWLSNRGYGIYHPRLSSDGSWIVFNGRRDRLAPAQVIVAKVQGSVVAGEKDWIVISQDGDSPNWSPDANLLYFRSDRDGSPCLWAQRLDPATKRPVGPPLGIQHFHTKGLSWRNLYLGPTGLAVARDKVVFNLGEHSGNIWMTQLARNPD